MTLEKEQIIYGNKLIKFEMDSFKKKRLLEGLDDIELSLKKSTDIDKYEDKMKKTKSWL